MKKLFIPLTDEVSINSDAEEAASLLATFPKKTSIISFGLKNTIA